MRNSIMQIGLFFVLCLAPALPLLGEEQEEECSWYYHKEDVDNPALYQIGVDSEGEISACWFEEYWCIQGTEDVNGKTYKKLYVNEDSWDVKALSPFPRGKDLYHEHVLDVREENGRVYALKNMYIDYLVHHAEPADLKSHDIYLAPADDENEILLYDFTLGEGDTYPSFGAPKVERVGLIELLNKEEKKVLWLSNGVILVEGIGCVHSIGTLVCYQNERVQEVYAADGFLFAYLKNFCQRGEEVFQCQVYSSIFTGVLHDPTSIRDLPAQPSAQDSYKSSIFNPQSSIYYDLQGRRLSAPPAKGMYIEDKRVKIRR